MEKKWSLIIILIVIVSLFLYFTGVVSADSNCSRNICFEQETNPKLVVSYLMMDSNGRIVESGFWKNGLDLFFNHPGCIYPQWGTTTTFYSNWDKGYGWKAKTDIFGDICYKPFK